MIDPEPLQLRPDRRVPLRLVGRRPRGVILLDQLIDAPFQFLAPFALLDEFGFVRRLRLGLLRRDVFLNCFPDGRFQIGPGFLGLLFIHTFSLRRWH